MDVRKIGQRSLSIKKKSKFINISVAFISKKNSLLIFISHSKRKIMDFITALDGFKSAMLITKQLKDDIPQFK